MKISNGQSIRSRKSKKNNGQMKGAKDNDQNKRDEEQWPKEKGRRDKQ